MEGCTSLTTVDVTPMVKVTVVGEWFMRGTKAFTLSMRRKFLMEVWERNAAVNDDISREEEGGGGGGCRSRSCKQERCVVKAALKAVAKKTDVAAMKPAAKTKPAVKVAVKAPPKRALTATAKKVVVKAATKKRK